MDRGIVDINIEHILQSTWVWTKSYGPTRDQFGEFGAQTSSAITQSKCMNLVFVQIGLKTTTTC